MMPLRLITYTGHSGGGCPRILLGLSRGSLMRFRIAQLFAPLACVPADWSKCSVVFLPTLKLLQLAIARAEFCWTVTVTWPVLASTVCALDGSLASGPSCALIQALSLSTLRPLAARPSCTSV